MVTKKPELTVIKKRSGRYAVRKRGGGLVHGADKVAFLVAQGLLTLPKPKTKE
jgi:hypothetical protein